MNISISNNIGRWSKKLQLLLRGSENPLINSVIYWLNLLTDTSDTVYDGITPTITNIEEDVDIINGEII